LNIVAHPHVRGAEYGTLAAMATIDDVDTFLTDFHAQYPHHPYPASLFDPAGRMGRWP
jgi:hypothetical protein